MLIALDNDSLRGVFEAYMRPLASEFNLSAVVYFDHPDASPAYALTKSAVELIALSRTSFLVGNRGSTFLHAVFFIGGLRQGIQYTMSYASADYTVVDMNKMNTHR